jgi:hypothetical protein
MLLEHKKAVIHGAGGAIGGAVARAFAHEGADLFLYSRTLLKVFSLTMSTERRTARQLGEGLDRVTRGIASSTRSPERHIRIAPIRQYLTTHPSGDIRHRPAGSRSKCCAAGFSRSTSERQSTRCELQ